MKLKLPELNQRIGLVLADGRLLTTRVEGTEEPELLIAPPSDQGVTYLLTVGEVVELEWTTDRGLLRGVGHVVGRVEGGVPLVRLHLDESSVIQRREFVRVECVMTVDVHKGGEKISASTLDLSGAGARLKAKVEVELEDAVALVVYMPDGPPIETRGVVVRVDGDDVFAVQFVGLDAHQQERVIRYVFAVHRREFANLRRSA
jgi:hypothetical protein